MEASDRFPTRDDMRTGYEANLTDAQRAALEELKARIRPTQYQADLDANPDGDRFVLRFLRATMRDKNGAREFDVAAAEKRLTAVLEFRRKHGCDEIRRAVERGELPEDYVKYRDDVRPRLLFVDDAKTGRPVQFERFGLLVSTVDAGAYDESGWVRMLCWDIEIKMHMMRVESAKRGYEVSCQILILDLAGGSVTAAMSSGRLALFRLLNHVAADMYPEFLGPIVVLNAPFFFSTVWKIVSSLMDPVTIAKITIAHGVPKERLLEIVGADRLPVEYGGTSTSVVPVPISARKTA